MYRYRFRFAVSTSARQRHPQTNQLVPLPVRSIGGPSGPYPKRRGARPNKHQLVRTPLLWERG